MTIEPPLDDAAIEAGLSHFVDACFDLARYIARQWPDPPPPLVQNVILNALALDDNSVDELKHLASWALNELLWTARTRPLSVPELRIKAIAERMYDAMDGRLVLPPHVATARRQWHARRALRQASNGIGQIAGCQPNGNRDE